MTKRAIAVALAALSMSAWSGNADLIRKELEVTDESLAQCKLANGKAIEADVCARWQRALETAISAERSQALREERHQYELNTVSEAFLKEQAAAAEKREREAAAAKDRARIDRERQEQAEAEYKARRAEEDRQEAALEKACGRDYNQPRVGMTAARADQCVGDLIMKSQINRRDGVVTTYLSGSYYLHVMAGKVVAWSATR